MSEQTLSELTERVRRMRRIREAEGESIDGDWTILKMKEELDEIVAAFVALKETGTEDARQQLAGDVADMLAFLLDLVGMNNLDLEAAIKRKWTRA